MLLRVEMALHWLCKSLEREILVTFLLARDRQSRAGLVPMGQGPGVESPGAELSPPKTCWGKAPEILGLGHLLLEQLH